MCDPGSGRIADGVFSADFSFTDADVSSLVPSLAASTGVRIGGLEVLGARVYDPATRGFLSLDPLVSPAGAGWASNVYAFAGFDPVGLVDPWGLSPMSAAEFREYRADTGARARERVSAAIKDNWQYIAAGAVAVAGVALAVASGPVGWAILGGMALSGGISVLSQGMSKGWDQIDWKDVAKEAAIGGVANALGFGALKYLKTAGDVVMGFGRGVVQQGSKILGAGNALGRYGSSVSQVASKVSSWGRGAQRFVGAPVSRVGQYMSAQGGKLGVVGSKVASVGESITEGGARVYGSRLVGFDAVQGGSTNALGYAFDGEDQSGWDYVRHTGVGAVTSTLPGAGNDALKKVSVDRFTPDGLVQNVAKKVTGKVMEAPANFMGGYVNSMSESNDWNPLSENNVEKSTTKGLENSVQGTVPLKESADGLDDRGWKLRWKR